MSLDFTTIHSTKTNSSEANKLEQSKRYYATGPSDVYESYEDPLKIILIASLYFELIVAPNPLQFFKVVSVETSNVV